MTPQDAYMLALYRKDGKSAITKISTHDIKYYKKLSFKNEGITIDQLRTIACQNMSYAYWFAREVDKCFHHETYQACLTDAFYVSMYYSNVMNIQHNGD